MLPVVSRNSGRSCVRVSAETKGDQDKNAIQWTYDMNQPKTIGRTRHRSGEWMPDQGYQDVLPYQYPELPQEQHRGPPSLSDQTPRKSKAVRGNGQAQGSDRGGAERIHGAGNADILSRNTREARPKLQLTGRNGQILTRRRIASVAPPAGYQRRIRGKQGGAPPRAAAWFRRLSRTVRCRAVSKSRASRLLCSGRKVVSEAKHAP